MIRWFVGLMLVLVTIGCRAPVPKVRDAFAAAGPTRLSPPPTGSYTKPDPYYPGAGGLSPPRATTQAQVGITPAPPYNPTATANRPVSGASTNGSSPASSGTNASGNSQPAGRFVAPPIMDVGASPRVRITRESTQGSSFTTLNPRGGMVATDLSREPSSFVPSARMLDIGDLPPTGVAARNSGSINLRGTFGAYPQGQPAVANDAWESRR